MFDLKFYKQVIDVLYHLECENQDEFPNEHQSILKKKKDTSLYEATKNTQALQIEQQGLSTYMLGYFKYFGLYNRFLKKIKFLHENQSVCYR